jgi:hypothetical protein
MFFSLDILLRMFTMVDFFLANRLQWLLCAQRLTEHLLLRSQF